MSGAERTHIDHTPSPMALWLLSVREAARRHRVDYRHVLSRLRYRNVVLARHHAWWSMRERGFSYPEIGRTSGHDHTTVMHGVRKFERVTGLRCDIDESAGRPLRGPQLDQSLGGGTDA